MAELAWSQCEWKHGAGSYPDKLDPNKYLWRTELPGKGCSTPILSNQSIFVTAPIEGDDGLLCYDLTGKEKWQVKVW